MADGFGDGGDLGLDARIPALLFALSVAIMLWLLVSLVGVVARASERRGFFGG